MAGDTILTDRFWSKVTISGPDECWTWNAGKTPFGYGVFHPVKHRTVGAHRLSLEAKLRRPIHPGFFACHSCDNPACVNPRHLYEGSHLANVHDAMSRGRHKRGSMDPSAKLDEAKAVAIRIRAANGEPNRNLAIEFGVAESLVSGVVRGTRWRHAGGPITRRYKTKGKQVL